MVSDATPRTFSGLLVLVLLLTLVVWSNIAGTDAVDPSPGCTNAPSEGQLGYGLGPGEWADFRRRPPGTQQRTHRLHLPTNYDTAAGAGVPPPPLLLQFHGWGGAQTECGDRCRIEAPQKGFVVVAMTGFGPSGWNSWKHGGSSDSPGPLGPVCDESNTEGYCEEYASSGCDCSQADNCWWTTCFDSVAQVLAVLDEVEEAVCVDRDRIWATGCSNGGMFTFELARDARSAPRLRGIAPIVGLPHWGYSEGPSSDGIKMMGMWGRDDKVVPPISNTDDPDKTVDSTAWYYTSSDRVMRDWTSKKGCVGKGRDPVDGSKNWGIGSFGNKLDCTQGCAERADGYRVVGCIFDGKHECNWNFIWEPIFNFMLDDGGSAGITVTTSKPKYGFSEEIEVQWSTDGPKSDSYQIRLFGGPSAAPSVLIVDVCDGSGCDGGPVNGGTVTFGVDTGSFPIPAGTYQPCLLLSDQENPLGCGDSFDVKKIPNKVRKKAKVIPVESNISPDSPVGVKFSTPKAYHRMWIGIYDRRDVKKKKPLDGTQMYEWLYVGCNDNIGACRKKPKNGAVSFPPVGLGTYYACFFLDRTSYDTPNVVCKKFRVKGKNSIIKNIEKAYRYDQEIAVQWQVPGPPLSDGSIVLYHFRPGQEKILGLKKSVGSGAEGTEDFTAASIGINESYWWPPPPGDWQVCLVDEISPNSSAVVGCERFKVKTIPKIYYEELTLEPRAAYNCGQTVGVRYQSPRDLFANTWMGIYRSEQVVDGQVSDPDSNAAWLYAACGTQQPDTDSQNCEDRRGTGTVRFDGTLGPGTFRACMIFYQSLYHQYELKCSENEFVVKDNC